MARRLRAKRHGEQARARKRAGGVKKVGRHRSAATTTWASRNPWRRAHDSERWRSRRGLKALAAKQQTAPMPVSPTTDQRSWLMRRGARLGRGAGERDRERVAIEKARAGGRAAWRPRPKGPHWRQSTQAQRGWRAELHPLGERWLKAT